MHCKKPSLESYWLKIFSETGQTGLGPVHFWEISMTTLHPISLCKQHQKHRSNSSNGQCLCFRKSLRKIQNSYFNSCSLSVYVLGMRSITLCILSQLLIFHLYNFIHNLRTNLSNIHLLSSENYSSLLVIGHLKQIKTQRAKPY